MNPLQLKTDTFEYLNGFATNILGKNVIGLCRPLKRLTSAVRGMQLNSM